MGQLDADHATFVTRSSAENAERHHLLCSNLGGSPYSTVFSTVSIG